MTKRPQHCYPPNGWHSDGFDWVRSGPFGEQRKEHPDPKAISHAGQHNSVTAFEVFWQSTAIEEAGPGWFWWSCQPGCLPDGDPIGPFNTSREAWLDATEGQP